MNDEIKVNDYVRTKDGYIAKVLEIDDDGWYECDDVVRNFFGDEFDFFQKSELEITKHSPNIIDLVEEDDYVNGHLVIDIRNDEDEIEVGIESDNMINKYLKEKGIKTICTKEQFEKIMYKVGE